MTTVKEFVLKRFDYYVAMRLSKKFTGDIEISLEYQQRFDDLVLALILHVAGQTVEKVNCKWPRDWWQAFRERWWPPRYLEKYPVQYERRTLSATAIAPTVELGKYLPDIKLVVENQETR